MENNNDLEKFLINQLSVDELDLKVPDLSEVARKKILARKKQSGEIEDFFSLIAAFLNFKIKLYQAVFATIIIGGIILFFTREDKETNKETHASEYVSNIASVRSSTVLSSISTFALTKEKTYGNRSN
ncbi:MAG: hypothetical protein H0U95_17990 [Bacteroidetes bacterium]|nr:hypothetical protein [Bacteroidota bacterium]